MAHVRTQRMTAMMAMKDEAHRTNNQPINQQPNKRHRYRPRAATRATMATRAMTVTRTEETKEQETQNNINAINHQSIHQSTINQQSNNQPTKQQSINQSIKAFRLIAELVGAMASSAELSTEDQQAKTKQIKQNQQPTTNQTT